MKTKSPASEALKKLKLDTFPDFLTYYRKKTEMTQRDFALIMGVTPSYIAQLEMNNTIRPVAFARALYKRLRTDEDRHLLTTLWMTLAFQEIAGTGEGHAGFSDVSLGKKAK